MARPVGTSETADGILRKEMVQWAKTHKAIREMLEGELRYFAALMSNNTTDFKGHLEVMQGLRELLMTSSRVLESGLRIIREENGEGAKTSTADPDDVYAELMDGKEL